MTRSGATRAPCKGSDSPLCKERMKLTVETNLERIAAKCCEPPVEERGAGHEGQRSKNRTPRSVGTGGGQLPPVTRSCRRNVIPLPTTTRSCLAHCEHIELKRPRCEPTEADRVSMAENSRASCQPLLVQSGSITLAVPSIVTRPRPFPPSWSSDSNCSISVSLVLRRSRSCSSRRRSIIFLRAQAVLEADDGGAANVGRH